MPAARSRDTGPADSLLGKHVLVKIHAGGVTGIAQVRPISPGHFVADTAPSVFSAIKEVYGPALIGQSIFDFETINAIFDNRLAGNPAARSVLDIALHDAAGKALNTPVYNLLGGCCQPHIPLEWSVSMAEDVGVVIAEAKRAVDEFGIGVLCLKMADRRGWPTGSLLVLRDISQRRQTEQQIEQLNTDLEQRENPV